MPCCGYTGTESCPQRTPQSPCVAERSTPSITPLPQKNRSRKRKHLPLIPLRGDRLTIPPRQNFEMTVSSFQNGILARVAPAALAQASTGGGFDAVGRLAGLPSRPSRAPRPQPAAWRPRRPRLAQIPLPAMSSAGRQRDEGHQSAARTTPAAADASMDADVALAKMLQQQEAAFLMFRGEAEVGTSGVGQSSEAGSMGAAAVGGSLAAGLSDEELAQRLQREDDLGHWQQVMAAYAGVRGSGSTSLDYSDGEYYSDDPVDPDNMTYEELQALSDTVGTVSKGLPDWVINSLSETSYTAGGDSQQEEQCAICRCEFEHGDQVKGLPCSHIFHPACIGKWLNISKMCPICNREVESQPKHK
ncbi:unnamed protein product [Ostreobium quekettii]|uniref:RING-type domain-containing protein n=1 Tax=Ostreobium quekettii TaxID=121088 RepID=A0A8S1IKJ2_9CHLO|nr:unnamed protein product [Ostreobium quekettii]|eukprot:evm.model.scf_218.11 EVM.evm.TU.scf_218.11   scf_218:115487-119158(+)